MSNLFKISQVYKPFNYPYAVDLTKQHEKIHWVEEEADLLDDVADWKSGRVTLEEKNFITQILRLFTQSDVAVGQFYYDNLIPKFLNNEVRIMLGSFANREGVHQRAYALLNDTLGLPDSEYHAFLAYTAMTEKHEHMVDADVSTLPGLMRALAKGISNEGISLFASFAMLLNFQRLGKMKGMGKIVEWSQRDETCFSDDTEILTSKGWVLFSDVSDSSLVAQYDTASNEISFTLPRHRTTKRYQGPMVYMHNNGGSLNFLTTPDHDMVIHNAFNNKTYKVPAGKLRPHSRISLPVAGYLPSSENRLTDHERLLIALQADGTLPKEDQYRNGKYSGYRAILFHLKKERKKVRLRALLSRLAYPFTENQNPETGRSLFYVKVPKDLFLTKHFDAWNVDFSTVGSEWAADFIDEMAEWDGSRRKDCDGLHYGSVFKANTEFVQTVAVLAGYSANMWVSEDIRKETFRDYHRVSLTPNRTWIGTGRLTIEETAYDGVVYCVTTPKGTVVTRRSGVVGIAGNCHVQGLAYLFRTVADENPSIVTDDLKRSIYDVMRETVRLEDAFVDLAFELGGIQNLTAAEVKEYIRFIADRRLTQMGLKENWGVEKNPLPWVDWLVSGADHTNFFEGKVTQYEVGSLTGEWSYPEDDTVREGWVIYTRSDCPYCVEAKALLAKQDLPVIAIDLSEHDRRQAFFKNRGFTGKTGPYGNTMPKIYEIVNVRHILVGGYEELKKVLA